MSPRQEPDGLRLVISELSEEEELFEWSIGQEALSVCDDPVELARPLTARGSARKWGATIYFTAHASGALALSCSRCAKGFEYPIEVETSAVFLPEEEGKQTTGDEPQAEDTYFYGDETVDVFPPLRDQINLAAPMKPLCSEDCRGLCPHCGTDLNENRCDCEQNTGDPRFAGLKKLLKEQEGENAGS